MTKETRGTDLAAMKDDMAKSYNATEKMAAVEEEQLYDPADQIEANTDIDKVIDNQSDGEGLEMLYGDEEINPPKAEEQGIFSSSTIQNVEDSWKSVESLGLEKVGVVLFKNIFKIAPGAIDLFSFKDEPDLYNSD